MLAKKRAPRLKWIFFPTVIDCFIISTAMSVTEPEPRELAIAVLRRAGDRLSDYFRQLRGRNSAAPELLLDAVDYSILAGGKRLRPALVLESFRACGGDVPNSGAPARSSETPGWRSALSAAAAVELIHTFSLVHDDLPAMDDDDLRRGRPTNHKVFGEAMAILAGDAMVTLAFEVIATDADPAVAAALVRELAHAAGPRGMIGGQVLDMDGQHRPATFDELKHLHRMKTGALLTASCRLGAISAVANEATLASLDAFGRHLGLAFQIIDDVLDETATPEQMGKATGKDARKGKNTYPGLLGLEASRREADRQLTDALSAVEPLGTSAQGLRALATFIVERTH